LAFAFVAVRFVVAVLPFVFCFLAAGFTATALRTGAALFTEGVFALFITVDFLDVGCGESAGVR
jgi:hypothetical protein